MNTNASKPTMVVNKLLAEEIKIGIPLRNELEAYR